MPKYYWLLVWVKRFVVVCLLIGLALLIRIGPLYFLAERQPYSTFYPAIMIAALYSGLIGGLLATFLSAISVYNGYFIGLKIIVSYTDWLGLLTFCIIGCILSLIGFYYCRIGQRLNETLIKSNRLEKAMDQVDSYIYIKDKDHQYVYANQKTLGFFQCQAIDLPQKTDYDFFPANTVKQLHAIDNKVIHSAQSNAEEIITTTPTGQAAIYWEVKTPIFDENNPDKVWGVCGISTDITERKLRENALRESEERFRSTFSAAAIGMALVDLEGRFLQANNSLCQMLGYTHKELEKMTFQQITHPDDLESDLALVEELKNKARLSYQLEKRYITKNGEIIWILLTGSVVHSENNQIKYFIGQMVDITAHKQLVAQLNEQANRDYLTQLFNRRSFIEHGDRELGRALRFNQPLAFLMIDIDKFKKINDSYGHKTGDKVLQNFSNIILKALRQIDILGRLGGEEFGIILPETDPQAAQNTAERLRQLIEDSQIMVDQQLIRFTISIGICCLHTGIESLEGMINEADKALYKAKNTGRNRVCMSQESVSI